MSFQTSLQSGSICVNPGSSTSLNARLDYFFVFEISGLYVSLVESYVEEDLLSNNFLSLDSYSSVIIS